MSDHNHEYNQDQDFVHGIVASPCFGDDRLCFLPRHSGLSRSDDGGTTWHSAYGSLEIQAPLPTIAVAFSPDFALDQTIFAGVLGGVLRSSDAGRTWNTAVLPSPPPLISSLAVSPAYARDGIVHAGTVEDGAFRSADRGHSWTPWNFGLLDLRIIALGISPDYPNDETLFAGTESGLFLSTNGGRAWRETALPTDCAPILGLAISPDYANDRRILAGTESNGLWSSDDRGASWDRVDANPIDSAVNDIVLDPDYSKTPSVLVVLETMVLLSRDGGRSWSDGNGCFRVEAGIASVVAPHGLDPGAMVLIASSEGEVLRISLPK